MGHPLTIEQAVQFIDAIVGPLATRDARQFVSASASLGIEMGAWDYATIRDEGSSAGH
jgi:hypothetical protein